MATLAQLTAESWWGREVVPEALDWLGDQLCAHYRRPRTAAGTKGDRFHLNGSHRSQEWIKNSRHATNRRYTVEPGLTDEQERWVAGFDFTPGSTELMLLLCRRLDRAVRAGELEEIAAWYGNVDGDTRVDGYDNIANRAASSDSSHLWHLHISFRRKHANNMALMRKLLSILLTGEDDDMPTPADLLKADIDPSTGAYSLGGAVFTTLQRAGRLQNEQLPLVLKELSLIKAQVAQALGKDPVNEQEIVQGILAGLGTRPPTEVANALRAVMSKEAIVALVAELGRG